MKDKQFFGNPVIPDIFKPSFNTRVIYIMGGGGLLDIPKVQWFKGSLVIFVGSNVNFL